MATKKPLNITYTHDTGMDCPEQQASVSITYDIIAMTGDALNMSDLKKFAEDVSSAIHTMYRDTMYREDYAYEVKVGNITVNISVKE